MISVPQSPVTFMDRSMVRCMSSNGSVRLPALWELNSRCSSSVRVMRSRWVERTVAVSPLTNLTSAQMWPFVWRQCLRTTPRAPDRLARTCMSRRRSMPILRLGFGPARGLGAGAVVLLGVPAAFDERCGNRRRAFDGFGCLGLCFAFGLVTARQAASAAQRCRNPRWRSIDKRATVASSGRPSFQLLFLPLLCVLSLGRK